MINLQVVAYLPQGHEVYCAVFDPDHGPCDCNPQRIELVTLENAKRAVAEALSLARQEKK